MRPFGFDGGDTVLSAHREVADDSPELPGGQDYGARLAEIFFPELAEWRSVLDRLALPVETAVQIAWLANKRRIDFQTALLVSGLVEEEDLVQALAAELGMPVAKTIEPDRLIIDEEQSMMLLRRRNGHVPIKLVEKDGAVSFLVTPERMRLGYLRHRIGNSPALARRLKMADPRVLRAAVLRRARPAVAKAATNGLFERFPEHSARVVANAWQGWMLGVLLTALPFALATAPRQTFFGLHVFATMFFFACITLRFAAVAAVQPPGPPPPVAVFDGDMPVYSVLIALYREANIVPQLLAAMERLVWPRDRLEIRLVCEADDAATLAAIRAIKLPPHVEVIEVPPGIPRTKPKALCYALPLVGGDIVALYDAEDDPHPLQLVEAWQRFRSAGVELASVQAPLEISNREGGIIARMFAFEYAALFRGLLPWLAHHRLMLPLGGTSNHFRRAALEEVGGWDPFNVTEDADLGIRLARFGYRTETISLPTYETAPRKFGVWLPQRTRWLKGWAQTWLVHMRDPLRLAGELGFGSFVIAQVLFAGMVASSILHPLLLVTAAGLIAAVAVKGSLGIWGSALLLIDAANIACGYISFLLLGWQTLAKDERKGFWKVVLYTPVYWMMMSLAGWRAVWQLWRRPHHWEKTPH